MTDLPPIIGYQVIDVTTGEPTRGATDVFSERAAIQELLAHRRAGSPDMWVMSAILEGDLDRYVAEDGPIRFIGSGLPEIGYDQS